MYTSRAMHISLGFFFLCELVKGGKIPTKHVRT